MPMAEGASKSTSLRLFLHLVVPQHIASHLTLPSSSSLLPDCPLHISSCRAKMSSWRDDLPKLSDVYRLYENDHLEEFIEAADTLLDRNIYLGRYHTIQLYVLRGAKTIPFRMQALPLTHVLASYSSPILSRIQPRPSTTISALKRSLDFGNSIIPRKTYAASRISAGSSMLYGKSWRTSERVGKRSKTVWRRRTKTKSSKRWKMAALRLYWWTALPKQKVTWPRRTPWRRDWEEISHTGAWRTG